MHGQVTVDGRQLNSSDRYGDWKILDWDGWTDSPDRKQKSEPRLLADGDYDSDEFFDIREITITGRLRAKSHDMAHEAENWLKGMILNGSGTMLVRGHGPDQHATVKLAGGIKCKVEPGTDDYMKWQIRLKANDPYKYGDERTASGNAASPAVVFQRGNAPAWPVVTLSGSASSSSGQPYTLTLNGRSVTVTVGRFAADPAHTIDFRTGILRVGSVVVAGGLGAADFSPINPGLAQSMSSTIGGVTVRWTDTYI